MGQTEEILQNANANLPLNLCLQFSGKYIKYNTFWILLLYDRKLLLLVYSSDWAYTPFLENFWKGDASVHHFLAFRTSPT